MQYRPTAAELLNDIADLLETQVIDAVSGPLQHQVRVAANLARILQREVDQTPGNAQRERKIIGGLLAVDPADSSSLSDLRSQLAAVVRHGEVPGHTEREVWEALVAICRDDLAIGKPGHDAWTGDT
jgi:hypothetical protein